MKLETVLNYHTQETSALGLSLSLGDGYLCAKNPLYCLIRSQTLALGFNYSEKPSLAYQSFPMGQLEELLQSKTIPYTPNYEALRQFVLKISPKLRSSLQWSHVALNTKPNYVFHESCHALVRTLRNKTISFSEMSEKQKITALLLEEAFANSSELLLTAYARQTIDFIFLEMNSFYTDFEAQKLLVENLKKYGFAKVFQFILMAYLASQFLKVKLSESDLQFISKQLNLNSSEVLSLKKIALYAFRLNPDFKTTTTELYLKLHSIDKPLHQALEFDVFQFLQNEPLLLKVIEQLTLLVNDLTLNTFNEHI